MTLKELYEWLCKCYQLKVRYKAFRIFDLRSETIIEFSTYRNFKESILKAGLNPCIKELKTIYPDGMLEIHVDDLYK